ncbi:unnamed protein product [Ranitomeya imitator]|uniref:Ig-like domain-containing protein n=1 Tax=Ranitomeya imitator TaxID=111125 RepID=A0ABN9LQ87_9NEOB|nr:unnamed protein product [Ranitomeya imitator]
MAARSAGTGQTGEELPANQSVIINQTESVTLACKVDGNPPASMVWVKGEVEVETNKKNVSHNSYQDLAFAFLCGLSISILIILMYKLITRKKWWKDKNYMKAKEPPASAELPENEIYMNVSQSEHKTEESADASAQLDPIGVTSEEDLHYSTIAFTSKPSKVPPSQPETEYAEIIVK